MTDLQPASEVLAQPRYKHCCDTFDYAPQYRFLKRNENGEIEEHWTHLQDECLPPEARGTLAPGTQAAIDAGHKDEDLRAAIYASIEADNAADEDSAVHAAMPLDAGVATGQIEGAE